jgi:hypothetical protein
MRKFVGTKSLVILRAQAKKAGVKVDDHAFRRGADRVYFKSPGVLIALNTFNGRFYGKRVKLEGVDVVHVHDISSDSTEHEKEPWFQALLEFFYTDNKAWAGSVGAL